MSIRISGGSGGGSTDWSALTGTPPNVSIFSNDVPYLVTETDPLSLHLDPTGQTMTGTMAGTGLAKVTAGVWGVDTTTAGLAASALQSVATTPGTYNNVTVAASGLVTAGSNVAYVTGTPWTGLGYITRSGISAGTGISYNNSTGVITNSAPDQTVAFTGGTNVTIGGTYPNFSITDNSISASALTYYALLDGTNQPFTGNINISKTLPEMRWTTTGDSQYARAFRTTTNTFTLNNYTTVIKSSVTEAHGKSLNSTYSNGAGTALGMRVTVGATAGLITTVTKSSSSNATTAYIKSSAGATLATTTFSGNIATFNYSVSANTDYRIEADRPTLSCINAYNATIPAGYPIAGTYLTWASGSLNGADTTGANNFVMMIVNIVFSPTLINTETTLLNHTNSSTLNERGIFTIGNYSGVEGTKNIYEGISHTFDLLGVSIGALTSTGMAWTLPNTITGSSDVTQFKGISNATQTTLPWAWYQSDGTTVVASLSNTGGFILKDGGSIDASGSTTGLKIGLATTQKLGFYNAAPVVQPLAITDLGTVLSGLGLRAAGTAYPITTSGAVALTGTLSSSNSLTITAAAAGLTLKRGANGKCGTFVATGATPVTVSNTSVAITDIIMISLNTVGGTVGMHPVVATITAATGFTVVCTALDTSTYNYAIISNAA